MIDEVAEPVTDHRTLDHLPDDLRELGYPGLEISHVLTSQVAEITNPGDTIWTALDRQDLIVKLRNLGYRALDRSGYIKVAQI